VNDFNVKSNLAVAAITAAYCAIPLN